MAIVTDPASTPTRIDPSTPPPMLAPPPAPPAALPLARVVPLSAGDASMAALLGGKGAGLAEMTRMGLPVPDGFVVTTLACREYLASGTASGELLEEVDDAWWALDERVRARNDRQGWPLLVSVRSGGRVSMPGMMETVLDVGLTDATVGRLADRAGARFAWDSYRRLTQMYGETVLGIDPADFDTVLGSVCRQTHAADEHALDTNGLREVVRRYRRLMLDRTGEDLPQDPREQLHRAVVAVFSSWRGDRARAYRAHEHIGEDEGTAVCVVEMVYGNRGPRSGAGVCFTRDPVSGDPGWVVDYLAGAQGEDVVSGRRDPRRAADLERDEPSVARALRAHATQLETRFGDVCDVEFTYEEGRLSILQTRIGKRSPQAAFVVAADLLRDGVVDEATALERVTGTQLETLLHDELDLPPGAAPLGTGLPAGPGAAVGQVAFTAADAVARHRAGEAVVLVRPETSAEDYSGMVAAVAVVTGRGGMTSHAAVVARGLGRPCVAGLQGLAVDVESGSATFPDGTTVVAGERVSVDGSTGRVFAGAAAVRASVVARALREGVTPAAPRVVTAVLELLAVADRHRRLRVRANAETGPDALVAAAYGAEGIGLCRTEHMLLGPHRHLVEELVLEDDPTRALAGIEAVTRDGLVDVLRAMDGRPVVVRLLDPPLHEFLPDLVEAEVAVALARERGTVSEQEVRWLTRIRAAQEANPMLGLRGVRLLVAVPELVDAQVRGVCEAVLAERAAGRHPRVELMVPLVADVRELVLARTRITGTVVDRLGDAAELPVGVMIELPRAALTSGALAREAAFFSYGTNDLTQTTWGVSRDDAPTFLPAYQEQGVVDDDLFASLDTVGVGRLVALSVAEGRAAHPGLVLGACGEQAGDPGTIGYLDGLGLDYVSCSPHRVPVARLEAGRSAVAHRGRPPGPDGDPSLEGSTP